MAEQTTTQTHTHPDGTTHSHPFDDPEHTRGEGQTGDASETAHTHEHTHPDGTTHAHEHQHGEGSDHRHEHQS